MINNNLFTPEEINSRQKHPFKLNLTESYDFALLQQDVFQIVSPHVESISDRKHKIISWYFISDILRLKKTPLIQRMSILTYTNKQFVCLIRAMYQKKQSHNQDQSSTAFTISHIPQTYPQQQTRDEFDLLSITNPKKLSKEYLQSQDSMLANIQVLSRYTQFDSITFNQNCIRNVEDIFHWFQILGNGISYELTIDQYERLKSQPNSVLFYDPSEEHCYKKAPIGMWITEVFMKHISMNYLEHQISRPNNPYNDLKQRSKQFQKYWKIITPQRKNAIISKVLKMKAIDMYQEHRAMIKVTRNGFPPILKSDQIPALLKTLFNSNEKEIFQFLLYTNINQTLLSHSVHKFYIALELQDEIKQYNMLQKDLLKTNKMKKKMKNKNSQIQHIKQHAEQEVPKPSVNIKKQSVKEAKTAEQKQKVEPKKEGKDETVGQKIIVKGTDLFYKKLEVSSTQHIVSFQSNFTLSDKKQLEEKDKQKPEKETKEKKNKKKKKKKTSHVKEPSNEENAEEDEQKNINPSIEQTSKPEEEKLVLRKSSSLLFDKSSQKSSDTTNDQPEGLKDEYQELELKNSEKELEQKISDPLDPIYKDLQRKIAFFNKQRKIIINRLMYVFAQHKLSFKVYGSSSCDAALPSSDIDIVVDPSIVDYFFFSYVNYKKKIINSLEYLKKVFEKFEWTDDFILLSGASIPLLTFVIFALIQTVNPGIQFDMQQGGHLYNNRKELKEEIKISVDITIEPYVNMIDEVPMHLGVESSQLIKEWISMFPFYLQLLVLLKLFAKNQNLNKSYHGIFLVNSGGISSFMQAVILADFYKNICLNLNLQMDELYTKKEKLAEIMPSSWNLTKLFVSYCKFISQFDEQKQIFDVNSYKKQVFKEPPMTAEQFCVINPLTGKIMSERCTLFPLYKKLMAEFYQRMNSKDQAETNHYLEIMFDG